MTVQQLPRVGVLVPSTDTTLEQELPKFLRDTATVHVTRMRLSEVTHAGLEAMERQAIEAARLLRDLQPDVVLFGCTSGTFLRGATHEKNLARQLADQAQSPVVTTAWALTHALTCRGRRVRLRTPYTDDLTVAEAEYLRAAGLEVTSWAGLGITVDREIAMVPRTRILSLVEGTEEADALLLSCTNLSTFDLLEEAEAITGLPTVSSNRAAAEVIEEVLAHRVAPLAQP